MFDSFVAILKPPNRWGILKENSVQGDRLLVMMVEFFTEFDGKHLGFGEDLFCVCCF